MALAADDGVELVYEFGDREAEAAAKVLARRLELLGIEGARGIAQSDGKRVVVRLPSRDRLEDVRATVARIGHLELRRVVKEDAPGYRRRKKDFDAALARGDEPEEAVPAESLKPEERKLWPGGLRWYRNPNPSESLKEDWILCELDGWSITEEALEDVRVARSEERLEDASWWVHFRVKQGFHANMAELTREQGVRLAIIVDDEILSAPELRAPLREHGQITMIEERDARAVAAAIGGGALPSKPELVEERAIAR
jgi:preprotein translocase subunit SecD